MTMCFFVLVSPYQAFGDVVLMPSADGHAQSSGANGITVDDTQTTIATFRSGGNNIRNGILEFDLSPYSAGTVVESATLEFELTAALTNPVSTTLDLKVGQYIGNLVVDTGDFEDFGNENSTVLVFGKIEKAWGLSQIDDKVRLEQAAHDGSEHVIVSKTNLVCCNGIVLVNNR